jgi:hypothetical protein
MDNKVNSSYLLSENTHFDNFQKCVATNANNCDCDAILKEAVKLEVKRMDTIAYYYSYDDETIKKYEERCKSSGPVSGK